MVNAMLPIIWPVLWVILSGIMGYLGNVTFSGTLLGYILAYGGQLPIAVHLACVLVKRSHYITTIRETFTQLKHSYVKLLISEKIFKHGMNSKFLNVRLFVKQGEYLVCKELPGFSPMDWTEAGSLIKLPCDKNNNENPIAQSYNGMGPLYDQRTNCLGSVLEAALDRYNIEYDSSFMCVIPVPSSSVTKAVVLFESHDEALVNIAQAANAKFSNIMTKFSKDVYTQYKYYHTGRRD